MKPSEMPAVARALLEKLLDRHERPDRQNVVRVRLDRHKHAAYFATDSRSQHSAVNNCLTELERQGLLSLRWMPHERGNMLEWVDLRPEAAPAAYQLLGRPPRQPQERSLAELLAKQALVPGWHADWLAASQAQVGRHKSPAPLGLDDPDWNADLLAAAEALARLTIPVLERSLSVRLFADSKRLDDLRGALSSILRRHAADGDEYDDDRALLEAHLLERVPEHVPVAGALRLVTAAGDMDTDPFFPSVALSGQSLREALEVDSPARAVVTVENPTSFAELARVRPTEVLLVLTAGFTSPTVIGLLRRLRAARRERLHLHWGDMDAGGIRILAHLRRRLGEVCPFLMEPGMLDRHRDRARPLAGVDREALARLRPVADLADLAATVEALLAAGIKLEQEALDLNDVTAALAARLDEP